MTNIKDLQKYKDRAEELKSEVHQAKGARDEALRNLKENFDVSTIKEAKTLLRKLTKKETVAADAFDTAMNDFEDKWADRLEE